MKTAIVLLTLLVFTTVSKALEKDAKEMAKIIASNLRTKNQKVLKEKNELQIGALKMVTAKVTIENIEYNLTWSQVFDEPPILTIISEGVIHKDPGIKGKTGNSNLDRTYQVALRKISECISGNPKEIKKAVAKNP
ncbi:MAG: hypothetical protein JWP09_919 [Candidatus Taylorbacteria bacterium]|nr:hypothetical protein [Candidatus Taylorbacteria bacterium]